MKGYAYILSNSAFPQLVRIGTTPGDPKARARELSSVPGVPGRYTVQWQAAVSDCGEVERMVHERLERDRAHEDREFFVLPLNEAIVIVTNIARRHEAHPPRRRARLAVACAVVLLLGGAFLLRWLVMQRGEGQAQGKSEQQVTTRVPVPPPRPTPPPPVWQLDPGPLAIGQRATVSLRNGSVESGVLRAATVDGVSLEVASGPCPYAAAAIKSIEQLVPVALDEAQRQACLAGVVAMRGDPPPGAKAPPPGRRRVWVKVMNRSKYYFWGKIRLAFSRGDEDTGEGGLNVPREKPLGPSESATHGVFFDSATWDTCVSGAADGEFWQLVVVEPVRIR